MTEKKDHKKEINDQYYTPKVIADKYAGIIVDKYGTDNLFIEPSAGEGVFIDSLVEFGVDRKKIIAFDIDPKREDIIEADFLSFPSQAFPFEIAIGNPPFGKGGSMAIHFMNKLSEMRVKVIAFINPSLIGVKHTSLKRLNKKLHLVYEEAVPQDLHYGVSSRDYSSELSSLRTYFQIWELRNQDRIDPSYEYESCHFYDLQVGTTKVKVGEKMKEVPVSNLDCDIVLTSHGKKVGAIFEYEEDKFKANVCRFLKLKEGVDKTLVWENLKTLDLSKFTSRSTIEFLPSISPTELIEAYNEKYA